MSDRGRPWPTVETSARRCGRNHIGPTGDYGARLGTLIAVIAVQDAVLLFSDGRVVKASDGAIASDQFSKVHRLTPWVGTLTAGRHLPPLVPALRQACERIQALYADEVVEVAHQVASTQWQAVLTAMKPAADLKLFMFLVGFDPSKNPRLYYLDSSSRPPMRVEERQLFDEGRNIEIAAIATTGDGRNLDMAEPLAARIQHLWRPDAGTSLVAVCSQAFRSAMAHAARSNPRIGGRAFGALISRDMGYAALRM